MLSITIQVGEDKKKVLWLADHSWPHAHALAKKWMLVYLIARGVPCRLLTIAEERTPPTGVVPFDETQLDRILLRPALGSEVPDPEGDIFHRALADLLVIYPDLKAGPRGGSERFRYLRLRWEAADGQARMHGAIRTDSRGVGLDLWLETLYKGEWQPEQTYTGFWWKGNRDWTLDAHSPLEV
jgi:hypothetical protein